MHYWLWLSSRRFEIRTRLKSRKSPKSCIAFETPELTSEASICEESLEGFIQKILRYLSGIISIPISRSKGTQSNLSPRDLSYCMKSWKRKEKRIQKD